jgi:hypothetical protein
MTTKPSDQTKVYRATIRSKEMNRPVQQVTIEAVDALDAFRQLERIHGEGTVFNCYNEEDAKKRR